MQSETCLALKKTLLEFADYIKDWVVDDNPDYFEPEHSSDVLLIKALFKGMTEESLMRYCLRDVYPFKVEIMKRDEDYFQKNVLQLFSGLPQEKVYHVYKFIYEKADKELKSDLFDFFKTMILLMDKYKEIHSINDKQKIS